MSNEGIHQNEPDNLVTYDKYRKELATVYANVADFYLADFIKEIYTKESGNRDPVKFERAMDLLIDRFLFNTLTDEGIYVYQDFFNKFPPKDSTREQMKTNIESSFASVFEYISYDEDNKELTLIDIFTEKKYLVLDKRFEILKEINGTLFLVTRLLPIPEIDYHMQSGGIKHAVIGLDAKTILKQYWKANKRLDFENHPERRLDFFLEL